jgi:formylglycine-generating enzyme required for sulfatase activity
MPVRAVALLMSLLLVACAAPAPSPAPSSSPPSAGPSAEVSASGPGSSQAASTIDPGAGKERTDAHGVAQVWVPAGTFLMGTDETDPTGELAPPAWAKAELVSERPQHEVSLSSGYWIDRTEVTRASFQAFIDDGGYEKRDLWSEEGWKWNQTPRAVNTPPPGSECVEGPPDEPKVCITWFEAEAYAAWRGGALPTEAQWEYAARGPSSSIFPWGDEWDAAKANVVESVALTPAGSLPAGASWVGALDMAGNAMEWVADWFSISYYKQEVREDPTGPEFGSRKVEKGGWWGADPYVARSAYRHFEDPPTYQDHHIGVRIVSEGEPPA